MSQKARRFKVEKQIARRTFSRDWMLRAPNRVFGSTNTGVERSIPKTCRPAVARILRDPSSIPSRSTTRFTAFPRQKRSRPGEVPCRMISVYAVKASRFLTHMKRLKEPAEPLERLFSRARKLGRTLGPVLYQLPPRWHVDLARLEAFLRALPACRQHAIEFRDPSLVHRRRYSSCSNGTASRCVCTTWKDRQPGGSLSDRSCTPGFTVRSYGGRYDDHTLDVWATWMEEQRRRGKIVYAYFNNDTGGHAPRDAYRLRARLMPFTSASGSSSTRLGESSHLQTCLLELAVSSSDGWTVPMTSTLRPTCILEILIRPSSRYDVSAWRPRLSRIGRRRRRAPHVGSGCRVGLVLAIGDEDGQQIPTRGRPDGPLGAVILQATSHGFCRLIAP